MADDVKKIIGEKIKFIEDDKLRNVLMQVMTELAERQDNIREELLQRMESECHAQKNELPRVAYVLVNDDRVSDYTRRNFSNVRTSTIIYKNTNGELDEEVEFRLKDKQLFLNVPCDTQEQYFNKSYEGQYQGVSFKYTLQFSTEIIELENKIIQAYRMYGCLEPAIFSPWARRAVNVRLAEDISIDLIRKMMNNPNDIDWQIRNNGLTDILLCDKCLLWNVSINDMDKESSSAMAPDDSIASYVYTYSNLNPDEYVWVEPENIEKALRTSQSTIELHSRSKIHNDDDFYGIADRAILFSVNEVSIVNAYDTVYFVGNIEKCLGKERIRTKADINFVLNKFEKENYRCEFWKINSDYTPEEKLIHRYDQLHSYYVDKNQIYYQKLTGKPICYVKFYGDERFLMDYANYVLYNLDFMYPEYNWVGTLV